MLYSAILLGLVSSLHCMGMCGPIALMLPFAQSNPEKKALQLMAYHVGRIASYATIGLIFGAIGRGFYLAGFQQRLSIFAGISIIIMTLLPEKAVAKYNFSRPIFKVVSAIKTTLGSQFKKQSFRAIFTIGLLNGLLPCGMVYAALFGALAMQDVGLGSLYMALFGIGTIPLMSVIVYAQRFVTLSVRSTIQKVIPYAMAVIGILFVMRGMGLNIPYISPSDVVLFVKATPNCN
jgi:sulfite exporter TauE/SafE